MEDFEEHGSSARRTLRCASCGEVIGVYEPLVHVFDGVPRETSRAADPHLARTQADACYHVGCRDFDTVEAVAVT